VIHAAFLSNASIQNNTKASALAVICTNCDRVKIVFILLHQGLKLDISEQGASSISAKSHVLMMDKVACEFGGKTLQLKRSAHLGAIFLFVILLDGNSVIFGNIKFNSTHWLLLLQLNSI